MGKTYNDVVLHKDIGLLILRDNEQMNCLVNKLTVENKDYLSLIKKTTNILIVYEQLNVKVTRKQILPIIQKSLNVN